MPCGDCDTSGQRCLGTAIRMSVRESRNLRQGCSWLAPGPQGTTCLSLQMDKWHLLVHPPSVSSSRRCNRKPPPQPHPRSLGGGGGSPEGLSEPRLWVVCELVREPQIDVLGD